MGVAVYPPYFFLRIRQRSGNEGFSEGTVTNSAIWLVLYPVSIFLSLPTVTLSWVAEYIPTFGAIFHKYIYRFSGWAVFWSQDVGHYLKPIVRDYSALIDFRLIFCDKWQMIEQ